MIGWEEIAAGSDLHKYIGLKESFVMKCDEFRSK
jgi:hypothetical protein